MKQLKTIKLGLAISLLFHAALFAQGRQTLSDGFSDPDGDGITGFTITDYDTGISKIVIDSSEVLQLTPNADSLIFARPNGWTLSGIKWQYSNEGFVQGDDNFILRATDVDEVSSFFPRADSSVYLISDYFENKVIVHHSGQLDPAFVLKSLDQNGPADADLYMESNELHLLVAYRNSGYVVKYNYSIKNELWRFGGTANLSSPSDVEKIVGTSEVLIADTGGRRVIIVDESTDAIVWEYTNTDGNFSPVDVEYINDAQLGEHILISDQSGHRVLLVRRSDQSITWQFGTGAPGNSQTELNIPVDADWIEGSGNIVIADKGNNRIFEVNYADSTHFYQWPNPVFEVEDVDPLEDGSFLVSQRERQNNRDVWLPTQLAFSPPANREGPIVSDIRIIRDQNGDELLVDFQSIFLYAQSPPSTTIEYQFRSEEENAQIDNNTPWRGPTGINSKYAYIDGAAVPLYTFHKPHTSCQFGAHLSTDSIRITPKIDSVMVNYNYYNVVQENFPSIYLSPDAVIGPPPTEPVSVVWDTLTLFWKRSAFDEKWLDDLEFNLEIRNAQGDIILAERV